MPGEVLVPVGGLDLDAAVTMFHDRGQAVRPDFAVDDDNRGMVDDVCRRLDGLPLAVELAAARLRSLPLPQLVERLDDRFRLLTGGARTALPRQQTLRAVVDWSYDLLFDAERQVFMRLSVFTGGCSLEAAEQVCSDDLIASDEVCDLLLHLVDKSLVIAGRRRCGRGALHPAPDAVAVRARTARRVEGRARRTATATRAGSSISPRTPASGLRGRTGRDVASPDRRRLRQPPRRARLVRRRATTRRAHSRSSTVWPGVGSPATIRTRRRAGSTTPSRSREMRPTELRAMVVAWRVYFGAQVFGPATDRDRLEAAVGQLRSSSDHRRFADSLMILGELRNRTNDAELLAGGTRRGSPRARRPRRRVGPRHLRLARVAQSCKLLGDLDAASGGRHCRAWRA